MLFRGRLAAPFAFAAQEPESLEAALFEPEAIPWDQLAFSSVSIALRRRVVHAAGSGQDCAAVRGWVGMCHGRRCLRSGMLSCRALMLPAVNLMHP